MSISANASIAERFLAMCAGGEVRDAYERYVAEDFRHHNAYFPSDRESLLLGMEQSARAEPNKSFAVKQVIESGDRVAVLSHLRREQVDVDIAVVHILRFEGGRIVEMWDVGQVIPKDSPNGLGMF
jgi:predicted SnoaL-like aldol condensation-catalyzing enzyme